MDDEARLAGLAQRVAEYVLGGIPRLARLGYRPNEFQAMVRTHGAVGATKRLLADPRHTSYGLQRLYEPGCLESSVEFAVLLPWFESLFTEDERYEARTRLILHDPPVDAKLRADAFHPASSIT
ncbi:hypothetical protein ACPPVO_01725 [Dactylosporangium sp. McL0621]|uniref:hypothetical protein n=1 Tax=Dactylosporangium sp. McL0621 TaxID=3415678 RepID=UPI003CF51C6D